MLDELPSEILEHISSYLAGEDLISLSQCNHNLRCQVLASDIWRSMCFQIWEHCSDGDILSYGSVSQWSPVTRVDSERLNEFTYYYYYYMERSNLEHCFMIKLDNILQFRLTVNYWNQLWDLFNGADFELFVPLLIDIIDYDLIGTVFVHRCDRLKYIGYDEPSLGFKKIASDLLNSYRHKHWFRFINLYQYNSGDMDQFDIFDNCEQLLIRYNSMDTSYHRLVPCRQKFFSMVERVLVATTKRRGIEFNNLSIPKQAELLAQVTMSVIRTNSTQSLERNYIEDLMILRVYARETKGTLLTHLAILQVILLSYGIQCELLQRHIKVPYNDPTRNAIYLTVIPNVLKCKVFQERHLRQAIPTNQYEKYMQSLNKKDALQWLHQSAEYIHKSNFDNTEHVPMISHWRQAYYYSGLPLSLNTLNAFKVIYKEVCLSPLFPRRCQLYVKLSGSLANVFKGLSPLDYKCLDSFERVESSGTHVKELQMEETFHRIWLSQQYMIMDRRLPYIEDLIGTFQIIDRTFVCILFQDTKDSNNVIVMDVCGEVSKMSVHDIYGVCSIDWSSKQHEGQLDQYLRAMNLTGKLGLFFDHFDTRAHRFVLISKLRQDHN